MRHTDHDTRAEHHIRAQLRERLVDVSREIEAPGRSRLESSIEQIYHTRTNLNKVALSNLLSSCAPLLLALPSTFKYWYPPNATIMSSCSVPRPASCARRRVTVNSDGGSMFKSRSRIGEELVAFPGDEKFVGVWIVPRWIVRKDTLDATCVISSPAVNGFAKETVACAVLFSLPVVESTACSLDTSQRESPKKKRTLEGRGVEELRLEGGQHSADVQLLESLKE